MKKARATFIVVFEADLDIIPGTMHQESDYHRIATQEFNRVTGNHYNMQATVVASTNHRREETTVPEIFIDKNGEYTVIVCKAKNHPEPTGFSIQPDDKAATDN